MEESENRLQSTIVVADDEVFLLTVLERLFTRQGFRVVKAIDGEQAFTSARAHRPSLVLTDMMMPNMTGAEVCERLKTAPETRGIPVIIMSSLPQESIPPCGADGYVAKPLRTNYLLDLVETFIS